MCGDAAKGNIGADIERGDSQRAADDIAVDDRLLKNKFFSFRIVGKFRFLFYNEAHEKMISSDDSLARVILKSLSHCQEQPGSFH